MIGKWYDLSCSTFTSNQSCNSLNFVNDCDECYSPTHWKQLRFVLITSTAFVSEYFSELNNMNIYNEDLFSTQVIGWHHPKQLQVITRAMTSHHQIFEWSNEGMGDFPSTHHAGGPWRFPVVVRCLAGYVVMIWCFARDGFVGATLISLRWSWWYLSGFSSVWKWWFGRWNNCEEQNWWKGSLGHHSIIWAPAKTSDH